MTCPNCQTPMTLSNFDADDVREVAWECQGCEYVERIDPRQEADERAECEVERQRGN